MAFDHLSSQAEVVWWSLNLWVSKQGQRWESKLTLFQAFVRPELLISDVLRTSKD